MISSLASSFVKNALYLLACALWLLPAAARAQESVTFEKLPVTPINTAGLKPLNLQQVGPASSGPMVFPILTFQVKDTQTWRHLFWFKEGQNFRVIHPVTLDLTTGQFKVHPILKVHEYLRWTWLDDKLYLAGNLPGSVAVYDPVTDSFTDLGLAFVESQTTFKISPTPDGKIAIAGNHPAEASLFDPKTNSFQKFGKVSSVNTYAYELGVDSENIYIATRGKSPWELIAVNRSTSEKTTITTAPQDGYINISGNNVSTRNTTDAPWTRFTVANGKLTPATPPATQPAPSTPAPAVKPPPKVLYDPDTVYDKPGLFTIHHQDPSTLEWKSATLKVPLSGNTIVDAVALSDGRLVGAPAAYAPAVVVDPATGTGRQIPLRSLSTRAAALVDGKLYLAGYPSASVFEIDLERPLTTVQGTPAQPPVPENSPNANPRLIARYPMTNRTGGHIALGIFPSPSGRVYIITRRHRHHRGFSIAWFNPKTNQSDQVDTGTQLDHLQIGAINQSADGKYIFIGTYQEPNNQLDTPVVKQARVFIFDIASEKIISSFTPVSDTWSYTSLVEIPGGKLFGLAVNQPQSAAILFRMDIATGNVEDARQYPRALNNLTADPDGQVWANMGVAAEQTAFVRINPTSFQIDMIGIDLTNGGSMLFDKGNLYLTGKPFLRKVILPPSTSPKP
jgi:hypothetical protein